jgi:DNA-directed RNA polymerase specialized sigma54-like protein
VGARTLEECLQLQLEALPESTPGREAALKIVHGNLGLLANREWARLQHACGCDEAAVHKARALIRTLDPRPGHRFGATEARYVIPDVIVKKSRERWVALINPASLPRVRLNRVYADALPKGARAPRTSRSRASSRRRAGSCARSSSASPPSSASRTRSWRASAASSSTARWR